MAAPILRRTGNPFLMVAYTLVALSLWTMDTGIVGRPSQPTLGVIGGVSSHHEMYPGSILSPNDEFYHPASSVLDELSANESNSAENHDKDHDKRHRAALASMVYSATEVLEGEWSPAIPGSWVPVFALFNERSFPGDRL